MQWLSRQLKEAAPRAFSASDGFRETYLGFDGFNASVLTTGLSGETLRLIATGVVELAFHTHAWCSDASFAFGERTWIEALYSEDHGFRIVRIDFGNSSPAELLITTGTRVHADAKGGQTWLASITFEESQDWMAKSAPVSDTCTLTNGQYGTFLSLSTDTVIGSSIVETGVWAEKDVAFFRTIVKPGMTVLDIGANIGHHTVVYSKLVGPDGRVVAFEPQNVIHQILGANLAINGCWNAEALRTCVGEEAGYVNMFPIQYTSNTNFGALGVAPPDADYARIHGERCRVDRLDTLLSELHCPITSCDFIKIDVQSYELFVLKGAEQTLRTFRPKLFLEISPHWMAKFYDYREIYSFLWSLGYEIDHPSYPDTPRGAIKEWSGRHSEEWDVFAYPAN